MLRVKYVFGSIFIFSILVFLLHTTFTKTAIFADARFYYTYTRSLIQDHDLNLKNEYLDLGIQNKFEEGKLVANPYPPGVSMLWVPLYLNAKALATIFGLTDSGYGFLYQLSAALTNIFLGIFGLYLVFKLLQKYFPVRVSYLTILALFGATNLLFYIAVEPINSHAASFFISSLFVFYFLMTDVEKGKDYYMALGFIGGIAGLVRTQDLLLLILPVIKITSKYKSSIKLLATNYMLLATGLTVAFLPQILLWKYFYNTFWYSPYLNSGFNFLKPQIIHVLFNTQNGLFILTPLIAISLIGSLFIKRTNSSLYSYILIYFFMQLYLVSSWSAYYQGGSYSIRMLVTTYPLLSFGLAYVIDKINAIHKERITALLILLLTLLNFVFIINYLFKY
jgi:hypothetical protein